MTNSSLKMGESVENSPGRKAIETMNSLHKDLVFKRPIGTARKRKKKVLDDESYVEVRTLKKCLFLF